MDPGERVTTTLQREFLEEALNSLEMTKRQKEESERQLKELFKGGEKTKVLLTDFLLYLDSQ